MTKKEYLRQAYDIDRRIKAREAQLVTLRDIATRISPHTDSVPVDGSSNRGNMANTVERIIDLERLIKKDIKRMMAVYLDIQRIIDTVSDDRQRDILRLRYLCFKKWDDVAEIMKIDERWARRLHNKAIQNLTLESPPFYSYNRHGEV